MGESIKENGLKIGIRGIGFEGGSNISTCKGKLQFNNWGGYIGIGNVGTRYEQK